MCKSLWVIKNGIFGGDKCAVFLSIGYMRTLPERAEQEIWPTGVAHSQKE